MKRKVKIDKKKTGENLRLVFLIKHLRYEDVADMLELNSTRVIYEWVNGNKLPSLENFINLSKRCSFKIEDILVIEDIF